MATIRPKVLSTSGHDELLLDADNLKLAAAPTLNEHGTNKAYVDTSVATEATARTNADNTLQSNIDALDTDLQGQIDTINGDITTIEGAYVRDTGDNMTGDLTLGTTQVVLNATTGAATFANGAAEILSTGELQIDRTGASNTLIGFYLNGVNKGFIRADGAATFNSGVNCDYVSTSTTSGSFNVFSNLGADTALNTAFTTGTGTQNIQLYNNGNAVFAGTLEAASVDGGTY